MKIIRTDDSAAQAGADPLDQLAHQAAQLEADQAGAEGPIATNGDAAGDKPAMSNADCLMMAGQMVRETLCGLVRVESPRRTLGDEALRTVADAVAPVLDKYGINLSGVAADYMVELRAVIVTVPVILAARSALLLELADKRRQADPAGAAPAATVAVAQPLEAAAHGAA